MTSSDFPVTDSNDAAIDQMSKGSVPNQGQGARADQGASIDRTIADLNRGVLCPGEAIEQLRALAQTLARSKQTNQLHRAWLTVAEIALDAGDHIEARRALESVRPALKRSCSVEARSEFWFLEAELYRSRGATLDATTIAIRHISDRSLQHTESYVKAFQSLIKSYLDEGLYGLAAQYAKGVRSLDACQNDSWRMWPFYMLEGWAYAGLAMTSHPLYAWALSISPVDSPPLGTEVWLQKAEALGRNLVPAPEWGSHRPSWIIDRRRENCERLLTALRVQRQGVPAWPQAQHLIRYALDRGDFAAAAAVGHSLAISMIEHSQAWRAAVMLRTILLKCKQLNHGGNLVSATTYLLSIALERSGDHRESLRAFQTYAKTVEAKTFAPPALPRLAQDFFQTDTAAHPTSGSHELRGLPEYLREAVAIIDSEFGSASLSIADIALRVGVTSRTLLSAFRYHFATNPTRYILEARLHRAQQLLRNRRSGVSVSALAEQCGFTHMGRFAAAYRSRFGKSPSEEPGLT
jgi:AraC-like DNA-binding protein